MISYHNKQFRPVLNTENGEVSGETIFYYSQNGRLVTATYSGGSVREGHLMALVDENGCLDMRYHHLNEQGGLMTGVCRSVPEILTDGRLRLHETWRWTSGDGSEGRSVVEEVMTPIV